ncbi:ABC transporter permease [Clostridiisalibacter paucivorans]|uniref:ABC transporter permease n=1 Tax=Clostridiisalibacter paucivorans TaxID=408753 RepID=UPI00047A7B69|nr:ABC transporter permease [Clostridiisalibacter paucivorans]
MEWNIVLETLSTQGMKLLKEHLILVGIALSIGIIIALPLSILLTRYPFKKWTKEILSFLNTAQGVPSLAVVAIFLPIMGVGFVPSVIALTLYGLLPIVRNTIAGINDVDDDILEAAKGMGMSNKMILRKVELPLALPVIIAGIQTSAVLTVGTATIAVLIGGGGLGNLIFTGISTFNPALILTGSIMTAAIAIILDQSIGFLQKRLSSHRG